MQCTLRERGWNDGRYLETGSSLTLGVLVIAEDVCVKIRQYVISTWNVYNIYY